MTVRLGALRDAVVELKADAAKADAERKKEAMAAACVQALFRGRTTRLRMYRLMRATRGWERLVLQKARGVLSHGLLLAAAVYSHAQQKKESEAATLLQTIFRKQAAQRRCEAVRVRSKKRCVSIMLHPVYTLYTPCIHPVYTLYTPCIHHIYTLTHL